MEDSIYKDLNKKNEIENKDNALSEISIEVNLSNDKMSATMQINKKQANNPPEKNEDIVTFKDVINELNSKNIVYGIDYTQIKNVLQNKLFNTEIEIAKGDIPKNGKDGYIKYYFDTSKDLKPKVLKNGKVDMFDLNFVTNVVKDQLLAEVIPPTEGKSGKTVTGAIVPAKKGKKPSLLPGKNVYVSEDKTKFYSAIDGQPILEGNRISVLTLLEIDGDVDISVGNIDFIGSVKVNGNVRDGFKIKSTGNVEINGFVEAATIESDGSIIIKKGIHGQNKSLIKAKSNIIVKYIENSTVEAGKDIIVYDAIMHSNVTAGETIKVEGGKSLLVGGVIKAGKNVSAKTIGSPMATYTEIEVGVNPKEKLELLKIEQELTNIKTQIDKIDKAITLINKLKENNLITKEKESMLEKLLKTIEVLREREFVLTEEKSKVKNMLSQYENAQISASEIIYSGVKLTIGNASLILRDNIEHATFYNDHCQIKFFAC